MRAELLARAREENRISSAAITGSAAAGREDEWSDVDLAFAVRSDASLEGVLSDWTEYLYRSHAAAHHVDTRFGTWVYRTFLLANTLQVDLAFAPESDYRPLGPNFNLVFGTAREMREFERPNERELTAVSRAAIERARVCIGDGELWDAEYFLGVARDNALAATCLRHDLPYHHGRGFDLLAAEARSPFEKSFAVELSAGDLSRALQVLSELTERTDLIRAVSGPALMEPQYGIGWAWLYALHVRSSIARRRSWQSEYMIRGMRNSIVGIARWRCGDQLALRRSSDLLPKDVQSEFRETLLRSLELDELTRAFRLLIDRLAVEVCNTELSHREQLLQTIRALQPAL